MPVMPSVNSLPSAKVGVDFGPFSCRAAAGLIVTSHQPGLLPTLHEHSTTPELLAEIVTELGGEADPEEIAELFARHGGDLRLALRELYDRSAGLDQPVR